MKRKHLVVILLCFATILVATVGYCVYDMFFRAKENQMMSTNSAGYAEKEIPHADPLLVGKWQNTDNPHWYKVYYDDYDEQEGLFWGKEWDESEDVLEEDLQYHGNGWFRWEKKGNELHEYATMEIRDVPIHRACKLLLSTPDSLVYHDVAYKNQIFRFGRLK